MKKTVSVILAIVFIFSCMQSIAGVYAYYDLDEVVQLVDETEWTSQWCTDTNPIRVYDPTFYFSCPPYTLEEDTENFVTFIDGDGDGKAPSLKSVTTIEGKKESSDPSYYSKCAKNTDDFIVSPVIKTKIDRVITFTWNVALSGDSKCTVYVYTGSEPTAEKIKAEGKVLGEVTESGKGDMKAEVKKNTPTYLVIRHTGSSGELTVRRMGGSFVRKKNVDFKLDAKAAEKEQNAEEDPEEFEQVEEQENQTVYLNEITVDFLRSFPEVSTAVYPYSEGEEVKTQVYGLYTVDMKWCEDGKPCKADDIFELGAIYTREITVTPKEGTVFSSPLKVYEAEKSEYFETCEPAADGTVTITSKFIGARFASFKRPRVRTLGCGASLVLHAECGFDVEGVTFDWDVSNDNFDYEISEDTLTCKITPKKAGTTEFKITVSQATEERYLNAIQTRSDTVTITAKMGFWQKFVNFFRSLFGIEKVYDA